MEFAFLLGAGPSMIVLDELDWAQVKFRAWRFTNAPSHQWSAAVRLLYNMPLNHLEHSPFADLLGDYLDIFDIGHSMPDWMTPYRSHGGVI